MKLNVTTDDKGRTVWTVAEGWVENLMCMLCRRGVRRLTLYRNDDGHEFGVCSDCAAIVPEKTIRTTKLEAVR